MPRGHGGGKTGSGTEEALPSRAAGNTLGRGMAAKDAKIVLIVVAGVTVVGLVIGLSLLRDHLRQSACEDDGGRWNPMDGRCEQFAGHGAAR